MFNELREKYSVFNYNSCEVLFDEFDIIFKYNFEIVGLTEFNPDIRISKSVIKNLSVDEDMINYLAFHIGLVELMSYWKVAACKNIVINAGYIDNEQIGWFRKLYFHGLGEYFYVNNIDTAIDEFVNITCDVEYKNIKTPAFNSSGNLLPIGGGKDSIVTMELLKGMDNDTVIMNPKETMIECSKIGGYENPIIIKRNFEREKLIKLNKEGFLNGHTPFSSLVAFVTYTLSYLTNKKYIVLSNESSANESNVLGTKINHQYSKSYEFEVDFNQYTTKYFGLDIKYFSFLRPLLEIQIAKIFSGLSKYHEIFRSCNIGSKSTPWKWCCNCPKCLFVYIMMAPFIEREKLVKMFGSDLLDNENLLETFTELIGKSKNKPFECVGTYDEVNYAVSKVIKKSSELPFLLKYYKENYSLFEAELLNNYNEEHNLDSEFEKILKENL